MDKPVLTVLMPVYNSEKYLAEAIDSILWQTLQNFQFLIIDDGSTDSSADIIRSYQDPRIRFVRNPQNMGISATLNKGIELSETELIARMDADDISYPKRLQKQYDYFLDNPDCVLLSTWAQEVTMDKEPYMVQHFDSRYYAYMLNFECWIYHPTVMYKKSAVESVGKYSLPYCEDYDLWWKIANRYKINNLEEVLLDYRCSEESLSRVTRKFEYEKYQHDLVVRNVNFYTEEKIKLTYEEVECLRYNYEELLAGNQIVCVLRLFKKLNFIGCGVIDKGNVNYSQDELVRAVRFQKKRMVNLFRSKIAKHKLVIILLLSGYFTLLFKRL